MRTLYRGETQLQFIAHRRRWYFASLIILIVSCISFVVRGFNYGIEFAGGTQFQIQAQGTTLTVYAGQRRVPQGRAAQREPAAGGRLGLDPADRRQDPNGNDRRAAQGRRPASRRPSTSRPPRSARPRSAPTGATTSPIKAIEGLIIFLIVVSIYISIRFQWRMAVGGIVALLHDLLVAAGVYSIVGFEVTPSTVVGSADHPRVLAVRHRRRLRQGGREHQGPLGRLADRPTPTRPTWPSTRR